MARDEFLSGPLAEQDLADDTARKAYSFELARAESGGKTEEDGDSEPQVKEPLVSLEPVRAASALLDYQADLSAKIVALCQRKPPENIGLVALPTGAGKTRTAVCSVIELVVSSKASCVLWLAPSRELLEQAISAFHALWPYAGARKSGLDLFRCHVSKSYPVSRRASAYFSTPQMLYQRLLDRKTKIPIWDLIVFDEAHLAEAPTFRDALTLARELGESEAPCFGLSATPGRSDEASTRSLVGLFNRCLLTSKLLGKDAFSSLRKYGVLADVSFETIPLPSEATSAKGAPVNLERFRATTELCKSLSKSSSTLVFAGSVRHAVALAVSLRHQGIPAAWVSGAMSARDRERTLRAFEAGAFRVLVNKTLLATGYDCPAIANVILTVPVRSAVLFEQMVGRASRGPRVGGNPRSKVWYFEDHIKWHGKPSSYQRYALSGWR